jgi:nucleotide-binding universal stress UspA family protein
MLPELKRILYCTQMGPKAPYIFRHALAIARGFDARIVVLHVHGALLPGQKGMVEGYAGKGTLESAVKHQEREELTQLQDRVKHFFADELGQQDWHDVIEEIVVAEGKPRDEILRYVEKTGADLVVMGSHRHHLLDVLLRSTAQGVIEKGKVPVLVVPVDHD